MKLNSILHKITDFNSESKNIVFIGSYIGLRTGQKTISFEPIISKIYYFEFVKALRNLEKGNSYMFRGYKVGVNRKKSLLVGCCVVTRKEIMKCISLLKTQFKKGE